MKVQFDPKRSQNAARDQGLLVNYGPSRRAPPRLRWLVTALILLSPIFYFGYRAIDSAVTVDAPASVQLPMTRINAVASGIVQRVNVQPGDYVRPGKRLVTLSDPALAERLGALEAEIDALSEQPIETRNVDSILESLSRELEITQQLVTVREREYQQLVKLAERGGAVASERQAARAALQQARHQRQQVRTRMAETRRANATDGANSERYTRLRILRARRDALIAQRKLLTVTAPRPGYVVAVDANEGERIGPGASLVTMTSAGRSHVLAYLSPEQTRFARAGAAATLVFADGTKLKARIVQGPHRAAAVPGALSANLTRNPPRLVVRLEPLAPLPPGLRVNDLPVTVRFARGPDAVGLGWLTGDSNSAG
ncbi:HlyD family secretion protein [Arhodomonas sp. AD133]|uniref:HlyD family secretion protein n=1 Tax=Arhodomonas sp. AD133 TaxID=3415009 RepID=UPI003EBF16AA